MSEIQIGAITDAEVIASLRAENERLRAALKPFALDVNARSLAEALGHITREHLLDARAALSGEQTR